jgi:thiamine pyrophosphokinase
MYNKSDYFDCVILAAGDFPKHEIPLSILDGYKSHIICCDGATDELLQRGYFPEMVVGDGDSLSAASRGLLSGRLHIEAEQDSNDLTKSVRYVTGKGYRKLAILGATGKREDHTLGNIGLLADYMDIADVTMFTDYGVFFPVSGTAEFTCAIGRQVSFFCMDSEPLTVEGVKWQIENRILTRWWQGTLNEAISKKIKISTTGKLVVFMKYLE